MGARIDITGHRYGLLVVQEFLETKGNGQSLWECLCDCGNVSHAFSGNLRSGHTTSCGCQSSRNKKTHGLSYTPEYKSWKAMGERCNNPKHKSYPRYGGRGIKICPQWTDPAVFTSDMGPRPKGFTLDREDNEGDYTPENCRWANLAVQNSNRRDNVRLTHKGETRTLAQWNTHLGLPHGRVKDRHRNGWSTKDIIETPLGKHRRKANK